MTQETNLKQAIPSKVVSDLDKALTYYKKQLGFKVAFTWGDPACYAGVTHDDVDIHLFPEDDHHGMKAGNSASMMIVDDVASLHEEFVERGVDITQPLKKKDWGMTDFTIADPDGNTIVFAEEHE